MDLVSYLPATDLGHDAIYTVVDKVPKFICFIPCKYTASAANLAKLFLANMVAYHGIPASIVSNCDPQFTLYY